MALPSSDFPRVGIPWRTSAEESANQRSKIDRYFHAVERAGGEGVLLSLALPPDQLKQQAETLDAIMLTGSPADIDPAHFRAQRHSATADADAARERTDFVLLEHALAAGKPVLAICYGIQSLNVFLGGTLIQDIPTELGSSIRHSSDEDERPDATGIADPIHVAHFQPGRMMILRGAPQAKVNSSHHQSILEPGRDLQITAHAPDGVVEAIEWIGDANWVVGVQWHPERMPDDPLAQALFRDLIGAARKTQMAK